MAKIREWITWKEAARLAGFDARAKNDPGQACYRTVRQYNQANPNKPQILVHPKGGLVDRESFLAWFEGQVEKANPGYAAQQALKNRILGNSGERERRR